MARAKPKSTANSAEAAKLPRPPHFQLATLVKAPPEGDDWVHELKYDGYRCAVAFAGGVARCYTRKGLDWTERFQRIAEAATHLPAKSALIDGEVVAFADGRTDFGALQTAMKSGAAIAFFAFDLIELDGKDLRRLPLTERKAKLEALLAALPKDSPIQYSQHVSGSGADVLKKLCAEHFEGIVAKRADSLYTGERSGDWLKIKCTARQEFVIIGWTPSEAEGRPFASLLLGYYDQGKLVYSGRVGTGFDGAIFADLAPKLAKLARKAPPVAGVPRAIARGARWVEPVLVGEIAFTEFTADGVLRHPSFLGLREDKPAREVVRERT
jgi:bifunctional non-homologous end joining protein LigD